MRGRRAMLGALSLSVGAAACAGGPSSGSAPNVASSALPRTRAERTNYLETSHYDDVIAFLDSLKKLNAPLAFGSIGRTSESREIPYVIASRPLVHSPEEARATGKPIVYVQGNIHAGEVEGKEALQALIRDLTFAQGRNVLDSIVLVAVPIYNADGNERFGPQARQRSEQQGPELVGQRPNTMGPNGAGLDLNRDYIKAEAPETRASLRMFALWNPDVFVDLHTTDGSLHGYALTYSPSLNPAAPLGDFTRDLLAEVRSRVRTRDGYETFDYGNFNDGGGREVSADTTHRGWYTYDHRPRFGTNYYGLRNRVSVLSEAFSHDPFERRVKSTYAFVSQLLSLVAERGARIQQLARDADAMSAGESIALRSALPASAPSAPVRFEILARTGDTLRTQAGLDRGLRRTGEIRTRDMPVFDRFVPTLVRPIPSMYVFSRSDTALLARLRLHGIRTEESSDVRSPLEAFVVDSVVKSPRPFQGHNEVRLSGHWQQLASSAGSMIVVRMDQPLRRLAAYLLDPESDDGLATWNFFDGSLAVGRPYPVMRVAAGKR
ncbi:MAG: M14 family metallopeptidase [bacterium]